MIAEWPAVLRRELACVVPPFGAKLLMCPVIARERIAIAFRGAPEFPGGISRESWHDDQQTARQEQEVSKLTPQFVHV